MASSPASSSNKELLLRMGGFSNFAVSFSVISILTGAITLYGYGLEMGGPLQMTLGWPVATVFTLALAASMAELSSAYPTSGAMYTWASDLGGPGWGWFVACLNIGGLVAMLAGVDYSCAQFLAPVIGIESSAKNLYLIFAACLATQALLNHFRVRLVEILNDFSVTVHILGVAAIVAALAWFAPKQPASFLFEAVNSNGRGPYAWAFMLGLLQAHWTYTGFDASAHMSEETVDARWKASWGIVLSVAVSGFFGYLLLMGMTSAIKDLPAVISAKDAAGNAIPAAVVVFTQALGERAASILTAATSVAMWFCGLATIASASRALYALARENGTPFAKTLGHVDHKTGVPAAAIWAITLAGAAAMIWTGGVPIVTSLSTVAIYVSYVIPVWLAWRARRRGVDWVAREYWHLGKYGSAVNLIAMVYTSLICVVLVMPPNAIAGYTLAGFVALLAVFYYFKPGR